MQVLHLCRSALLAVLLSGFGFLHLSGFSQEYTVLYFASINRAISAAPFPSFASSNAFSLLFSAGITTESGSVRGGWYFRPSPLSLPVLLPHCSFLVCSALPFQLLPVQIPDCDMPERLPENDFLPVPECLTVI